MYFISLDSEILSYLKRLLSHVAHSAFSILGERTDPMWEQPVAWVTSSKHYLGETCLRYGGRRALKEVATCTRHKMQTMQKSTRTQGTFLPALPSGLSVPLPRDNLSFFQKHSMYKYSCTLSHTPQPHPTFFFFSNKWKHTIRTFLTLLFSLTVSLILFSNGPERASSFFVWLHRFHWGMWCGMFVPADGHIKCSYYEYSCNYYPFMIFEHDTNLSKKCLGCLFWSVLPNYSPIYTPTNNTVGWTVNSNCRSWGPKNSNIDDFVWFVLTWERFAPSPMW